MQIELLKDIVSSVAGRSAVGIVDLLHGKKNVNEFLIAKKLHLTINQTRTILYKLADEGLVSFIRKKDSKKGGWYTYFWTLNSGKSLIKFKDKLENNLNNINTQITNRKTRQFFFCPNCSIEYNEEHALSNDYTCPECGEILSVKDNTSEIEQMEKEVVKIQNILKSVEGEINVINTIEEKAKGRKLKAEAKKKELERLAKKKAREKQNKGNQNKKKVKKSSKKR